MEKDMALLTRYLPVLERMVGDIENDVCIGNDPRATKGQKFGEWREKMSEPMDRMEERLDTLSEGEYVAFSALQSKYMAVVRKANTYLQAKSTVSSYFTPSLVPQLSAPTQHADFITEHADRAGTPRSYPRRQWRWWVMGGEEGQAHSCEWTTGRRDGCTGCLAGYRHCSTSVGNCPPAAVAQRRCTREDRCVELGNCGCWAGV